MHDVVIRGVEETVAVGTLSRRIVVAFRQRGGFRALQRGAA